MARGYQCTIYLKEHSFGSVLVPLITENGQTLLPTTNFILSMDIECFETTTTNTAFYIKFSQGDGIS